MNEVRILQLGEENFGMMYEMPKTISYHYARTLEEPPRITYDLVILDRMPEKRELFYLEGAVKAYCLYATDGVGEEQEFNDFFQRKQGKRLKRSELGQFLWKEARYYYPEAAGEAYDLTGLTISRGFAGSIVWNGNVEVVLSGEFGKDYRQIAFFRNYIPIEELQTLEFWLEYKKGAGVSLLLEITKIASGTADVVEGKWVFDEKKLQEPVKINNRAGRGLLFVSLRAKGLGSLHIVALHNRPSREGHGYFLPGGERFVTSKREELFCYFDPGDRKPPLNVYFSGCTAKEGFEGYDRMKSLGAPFLLLYDPRLKGAGSFMGAEEYESMVLQTIENKREELGFLSSEVICSGLSVGSFGALYYSCDLQPHAILLGKPLASYGDAAANERLIRPGGFPLALDVLMYQCEKVNKEMAKELNERFWNKFDRAEFGQTKFIISYMIEDDFDATAYERIISHLKSEGTQVYGKGLHGRHDDDTAGIEGWYFDQYCKVMKQDFHRG